MKSHVVILPDLTRMLSLFPVFFLAMFMVSCDTEANNLQENTSFNLKAQQAEKKQAAPTPGDLTITELAVADERFGELVKALTYVDDELNAGLVNLFLSDDNQFTVFAPNNEAFGRLYATLEVDGITDLDPELVLNVLKYHVTEGRRAANSVVPPKNEKTIQTLLGEKFKVNSDGQIVAIGNVAGITDPNISASNGIIHEISEVLLPITL